MRPDQLQELETLESRATQGKWVAFDDCVMVDRPNSGVYIAEEVGIANGDFIAALRNAAPALLAAARENARLKEDLKAAREECEMKRKHLCEHVADMTTVSMNAMRTEEELRDVQKQNDANRRLLNNALNENARLRAVVEAAMKVARPGTLPACLTEQARFHTNALKDLDSALSALDAKGGG